MSEELNLCPDCKGTDLIMLGEEDGIHEELPCVRCGEKELRDNEAQCVCGIEGRMLVCVQHKDKDPLDDDYRCAACDHEIECHIPRQFHQSTKDQAMKYYAAYSAGYDKWCIYRNLSQATAEIYSICDDQQQAEIFARDVNQMETKQ